jgi:hypothetical protein
VLLRNNAGGFEKLSVVAGAHGWRSDEKMILLVTAFTHLRQQGRPL